MLSKIIFSNENFSVLVSEGVVNGWNEFELVRKNFEKSKNGIARSLRQFNTYLSREISTGLTETEKKIIFNNLRLGKNNLENTYNYFKIKKDKGKYKCELCGQPRIKLIGCHIIKEAECKKNYKSFNDSIINRLFMCSNCHDDTEKHWKEIKNKKRPKKELESKIKRLLKKRQKLKTNIIKNLKSDINKYKKGIELIENIKKEIEKYKKQDKNIRDNHNKEKKILSNKNKQEKDKITREVEKSMNEIRKIYYNRINKIRKKYVNPKIRDKRINKIKTQRNKDINKKRKIKKEKHKKLDKIKNRRTEKLDKREYKLFTALYEKFKDRIRKRIESL